MRKRGLFIAYGVPTGLLLLSAIAIATESLSVLAPASLVVFSLTSPLWAFLALRIDRRDTHRQDLLNAVDFQLTMLCGYLLGGLLIIVFIGTLVILGVLVLQVAFGADVVWQAAHGKPIPEPRVKMLSFASRLGLA